MWPTSAAAAAWSTCRCRPNWPTPWTTSPSRIPIPFVCVDFLFDGERYWFSEIEPDGAIVCPDHDSDAVVRRQRSIIEARFRAYRRGHARWLGHVSSAAPAERNLRNGGL